MGRAKHSVRAVSQGVWNRLSDLRISLLLIVLLGLGVLTVPPAQDALRNMVDTANLSLVEALSTSARRSQLDTSKNAWIVGCCGGLAVIGVVTAFERSIFAGFLNRRSVLEPFACQAGAVRPSSQTRRWRL